MMPLWKGLSLARWDKTAVMFMRHVQMPARVGAIRNSPILPSVYLLPECDFNSPHFPEVILLSFVSSARRIVGQYTSSRRKQTRSDQEHIADCTYVRTPILLLHFVFPQTVVFPKLKSLPKSDHYPHLQTLPRRFTWLLCSWNSPLRCVPPFLVRLLQSRSEPTSTRIIF